MLSQNNSFIFPIYFVQFPKFKLEQTTSYNSASQLSSQRIILYNFGALYIAGVLNVHVVVEVTNNVYIKMVNIVMWNIGD